LAAKRTAMLLPIIGLGLQTMMKMNGVNGSG